MAGKVNDYPRASVAIFSPQSKAPGEIYLKQLHTFLCHSKRLEPLAQSVLGLKDVWNTLAHERQDIADLGQWPQCLQDLSEWIITGQSSRIANCVAGMISLPLLVIIQVCQYLQYLELCGLSHSEFMAQLRHRGGVQGYCGGLLPALAIACSKNEAEVVVNAVTAMRLALAIGTCGELGDDKSVPGATTIVVRTKRVGQGDELIERFPGAYISAITDPKTISIVGPVPVLFKLQSYAREQGMLVQEMHIRGKVHNPENSGLAQELCQICDKIEIFQLPHVGSLQAPVRSNRTGDLLKEESLTHETVNVILASRCEWYTLLIKMAKDLDSSVRQNHTITTFGFGNCVPLSPFYENQLQIIKVDAQSLIADSINQDRQNQLDKGYSPPKNAIAITGASCRLPGADSMEELWDLISKGHSKHTEISIDRFDVHGSFRASQYQKHNEKKKFYGNFIHDVDTFDHAFFGINHREAVNMDPQQRILLELAYQAMDSSGYLASHRREAEDSVGCFIGASFAEYLDNTNAYPPTAYTSTGTIRAFLCGRISHYFGWSGPAEVLDTACSSSLVAINRACKAIQGGECNMALAGGVNVMTGINNFLDLSKAGFLSSTGQCKPFDQAADGYCRSEGGGLVVLKLLSQALADGDQILGVIPSIATNQGGLSSTITTPHAPAQRKLYQNVLHQAGIKPDQVSYVEAHGTGTQAGDPVEIASIREVFGGRHRSNLLNIGSLKGNIGHTETAAGVASLLKILVMLSNSSIPPLASHKSLNHKIAAFGTDKLSIAQFVTRWQAPLLTACINSYGAAGSNCAMICCEGPPQETDVTEQSTVNEIEPVYPIIVSGASDESLHANAKNLGRYLQMTTPKLNLGDVAFTLCERRKVHPRIFVTCTSSIDHLAQVLGNEAQPTCKVPQTPKRVVLAFGGQNKRSVDMDQSLYASHPQLRTYIDECNKMVMNMGFPTLLPSIFQSEPLLDVVTLQCGTFAMQYAFAKCWIDAGLQVDAVVGHSFGELTAMAVSGVLSLWDGLKLVATRASLMASKWGQERGVMLVIHSSREIVQDVIAIINAGSSEPEIEIACYNSPSSQVVVGSSLAIDRTESLLRTNPRFSGNRSQRLDVTHGFHSKFTENILDDIDQISASLIYSKPIIPLETCTAEPSDEIAATRPSKHAREPVYFSDAILRIEQRFGPCIWLEAGLGSPIIPMIRKALNTPDDHFFQAMKISDSETSTGVISNLIAKFWCEGIPVSYWKFLSSRKNSYKQIWLPPYRFQRTAHWLKNVDRTIEAQKNIAIERTQTAMGPQESKAPSRLVNLVRSADQGHRSSEFSVNLATQRFTRIVHGHAVRQRPLCPASMYMECVAMGVQLLQGNVEVGNISFLNLSFHAALGVDLARAVSLTFERCEASQEWTFLVRNTSQINSKSKPSTNAKGTVALTGQTYFGTYERLIADRIVELEKKQDTEKLMSNRAYGLFSRVVHYADFLRGISHITLHKTEAIANIEIPIKAQFGLDESMVTQYCDTIAIDTFIQVLGLLINSSSLVTDKDVFVATGVDRISMSSACDFYNCKSWIIYAKYTSTGEGQAAGDIFVMTREGAMAMIITGAQFTKLLISKLERILDDANAMPSQDTTNRSQSAPQVPLAYSETSYTAKSSDASETSSILDHGTPATSVEGNEVCATPAQTGNEAGKSLRSIIASYTGLSPAEIAQDTNLSDIGVDSLAAVELAGELQTMFSKEITAEDLLTSSYKDLSNLLSPFSPVEKVKLSTPTLPSTEATILTPLSSLAPASPSSSSSVGVSDSPQHNQGPQVTPNFVLETSEASTASISVEGISQELDIDSLSTLDLKSDFENASSTDPSTVYSTTREVLDCKRARGASQKTSSFPVVGKSQMTHAGQEVSSQIGKNAPFEDGQRESVESVHLTEALIQCEAAFQDLARKRGFLNYWRAVAPKQDELMLAYICEAFQALGTDIGRVPQGEQVTLVPHQTKHEKVMKRIIKILEKQNLLTRKGPDLVRGSKQTPSLSSQDLHEQFLTKFPLYAGEAQLMALTGSKLADCLTGKIDPLALMFRSAAAQKVMEEYYCASPMLSTLTEQLVTFLRAVVTSKSTASSRTPIKILEVGAGFGGTTTRVAEMLQASGIPISYKFSDISPSLVKGAKTKFSRYNWMDFQVLNLENDMPASLRDTYDIVIGTNCVHATTNKTKTISRLKSALNTQGFVVLSEVTQEVDWYDIVFGLLDGWWLANDGSIYPLQPPDSWARSFEQAGFSKMSYSQGQSLESNTQRLLVASNKKKMTTSHEEEREQLRVRTAVYKEVDDTKIEADVYLPVRASSKAMPVALMIHGGGYMTLSRKAIRPFQTALLLAHNVLPVSIDYRLCPEINLIDGPIADVCDAYAWTQKSLQAVVESDGILIDTKKIAVVGWSSGGHLAMTTAWKSKEAGLEPPAAILSFYGPTDFESGDLDVCRAEKYPEQRLSMDRIISSLPTKPITSYTTGFISADSTNLGWLRPGDPRCELVLSLFKEGHGLPLLLNGIRPSSGKPWSMKPPPHLISAISPTSQVRLGNYTTPTFLIHGTEDEIVPYHTAVAFSEAMREKGLRGGLAEVKGAKHIHDLTLKRGDEKFAESVEVGYKFLFKELEL